MRDFALTFLLIAGAASSAHAQTSDLPPMDDKYHVSREEKIACTGDAVRLCSDAYPDEDALIVCMKAKHAQLSGRCQAAFDVGIRRRRL